MQAQAFRQLNEQEQITLTQSQVAVKTLISASFGCILFLRSLLPEENFGQTHLIVGDSKSSFSADTPASSQVSNHDGGRASRYKIMTVKRGFSLEGDEILDYLEKGAFDALEKQYLRRMIFALYIDKEDPQNIVEAWNFDFTYHKVPGTNLSLPMMSMSDSNIGQYQSSVTPVVQGVKIRSPTLGEVKGSIRNMVHKLIAITQTLEDLPKKRFATFKLEYYPHTPDEYEPPLFIAGDPAKSKLTLSTHDVTEPPIRVSIGKLDSGFGSVSLEVHSVASTLPTGSGGEDGLHIIGSALQVPNGTVPAANTFGNSFDGLAIDSSRRNIVWDAEIRATDAQGTLSESEQEEQNGLIGERMDDGTIVSVSFRSFTGKTSAPVLHVDYIEQTQSGVDETQLNGPVASTSPALPHSSPARSLPTPTQTSDVTEVGPVEPDVADTMGRLNLTSHEPTGSQLQAEEPMNLETQQVFASWTSEQTQVLGGTSISGQRAVEARQDDSTAGVDADEDIDIEVHCDCAITKEAEDYDVCQCDGPCRRWVHLWCHGYHGSKDHRLPEVFRCFECRLRGTQASVVKGEALIKECVLKYAELALFRRALKIVEVENPPNATEFRKLIGCNPPVAAQLWKRLEGEGFVGPESVEEDGIGMFESRSMVLRKAGKSKIRKTAKTKYTKNPLLTRMIEPFFDPSEGAERKHIGLGKKSRTRRSEQLILQKHQALQGPTNVTSTRLTIDPASHIPPSSSRVHNASPRRALSPPQAAIMMDIDKPELLHNSPAPEQAATLNGKRKAMERGSDEAVDGLNLRRSKRIKVSIPQKNIDLDW